MKKEINLKQMLGEVMMMTYEHIWSTILTMVALICLIYFFVSSSLETYDMQIAYLEKTLNAGLTIYQVKMWIFDILAMIVAFGGFIYISELVRYHFNISLFEIIFGIDIFAEDEDNDED